MTEIILNRILNTDFLMEIGRDIDEMVSSWAKDHRDRRRTVADRIISLEQKNSKIYELFELHGKDTPNLRDITKRLRSNNAEIQRLESTLANIDLQKRPEATVSKEDLNELASSLRYIVQTTDNAKKLRHFFASFIEKIWVEDTLVRIEYRPECLIGHQEPIAVPSRACWLPERALLGTRVMAESLPYQFHKRAQGLGKTSERSVKSG